MFAKKHLDDLQEFWNKLLQRDESKSGTLGPVMSGEKPAFHKKNHIP